MDLDLATCRLNLRAPRMVDAPQLARLLNNFEVTGNLAVVPHPYGLEDARRFIASCVDERPEARQFVVDLPGDGPVGCVGISTHERGTEVGYWLGEPYWGRGLMSEAVRAALGWFFTACGADRIVAGAFHFNMASLAIQHKLGFVEVGRSIRHSLARGAEIEHIDTELTRDAFMALKQ